MLSDADHAVRRSGIGSSEIAAVAGEHPYCSPHKIWLLKRGLIDPDPPNDATWLGNEMEPIIAKRYEHEMGVPLVRGPGTKRHPVVDWAVASTDYEWADGSRIVECKWVGIRPMPHWTMEADGAPPYVNLQKQWQMFVRDVDYADTAVIFGATADFRIYPFRRDDAIIDALVAIGRRFWDLVETGQAPPPDSSEDAKRVLSTLYGRHRGPRKPAPPEAAEWFARYMHASQVEEVAASEKMLAGNHLRSMIGDAEGIEGEFGAVTWKADKRGVRTLRMYPRKERAA